MIVLHGSLDATTSSGYVEGWAFDDAAPLDPLNVTILSEDRYLADGIAGLYNANLADGRHGTGWCAFRLKISASCTNSVVRSLSLSETSSRRLICCGNKISWRESQENDLLTLDAVVNSDPTLVSSIDQLQACGAVFANFVANEGVDLFIRYAHIYILGRPVDAAAQDLIREGLHDGSFTPYGLLKSLYESDEFRSSPRLLLAPPYPGFAFRRSATASSSR